VVFGAYKKLILMLERGAG